jgi:hypothetical protein
MPQNFKTDDTNDAWKHVKECPSCKRQAGLMTGQEFYDRFEKEWGPWPFPSYPSADWFAALKTARRAAGLK